MLPDLRLIKTAREAGSRLRHVLRNKCYPPVSSQKYKEDYHYFRRLDLVGLFLRATKMVKGLHAEEAVEVPQFVPRAEELK